MPPGVCTQGAIRIAETSPSTFGVIEICINGAWGAVCSDEWDNLDARVTCRQLGYSPYGNNYHDLI